VNINEGALRTALMENLREVNRCIAEVERQAKRLGTEPQVIRDERGTWVYPPLLVAKAQTLHALTLLQTKEG
jgi:hypothetical protein